MATNILPFYPCREGGISAEMQPIAMISDPVLAAAMESLAPPFIRLGHRLIQPGDADALRPSEAVAPGAVAKVHRQSGAGRLLARSLLAELGHADAAIPRGPRGAPIWPAGIVGSLAHDAVAAVAAVARRAAVRAVGIDVEPAEPLPAELVAMVTTEAERRSIPPDVLASRAPFALKEAVYKAANTVDGRFLDFPDVRLCLTRGCATTAGGLTVNVSYALYPRVLALAWIAT